MKPVPPVTSVFAIAAHGRRMVEAGSGAVISAACPRSTAVVADTTSYLPPELIADHDVHLVSLYVGLEGDQQRESDITDLDALLRAAAGVARRP